MNIPAPQVRFLNRSTPPHIFSLILLASLSAAAMNIFLPSLPTMAVHFDAPYRVMQLTVALYLGVSAVLQLFIGPISDSLGRRPVMLGGLVGFLAATLGCIFAPTIEVFLFCRMCQAVIAAAMVLSRAVVRDMFSQDQAASMIGYVAMGMAVVPMISPAIGGALDQLFGWTAAFWALFVLGAAALWITWADMGETLQAQGRSMRAQFREYPELLKSPRFWGYSLASGLSSGSFFAFLGGAPFVGSVVFGMTPATLGLYIGAPAIGYFLGNFLTGRYATRFGVNRMVMTGCIITLLACTAQIIVFWLGQGTPLWFFGAMTIVGIGNGLVIPNATAGMLSVRPQLAGTASGLGGSMMIGLGAGLSAMAGLLLTPQTGAMPLLLIMAITALGGFISIGLVVMRERHLHSLPLS
jgi:DHA1 family bicyclomycin/chloramphenicol resistance-like MFS transporter